MARYLMRADDGSEVEIDRSMHTPPKRCVRGGKVYKRVMTGGIGPPIIRDREHLAHSAPRRWTPGLADKYDKWGPHGVAKIENAADKRRFSDALKRVNPHTSWAYDP